MMALGIEVNPILRIQPITGKRYPMVVVKRMVAKFKPTSVKIR